MAKKITVSVPEKLHEKMEKWRQSVNLSKLFQEAIAEAIKRKEDFQKRIQGDLDLSETIERLRREKAQHEGNYFDSGCEDGHLWARSAHYKDLVYAVNWTYTDAFTQDAVLGPYFNDRLPHIGIPDNGQAGQGEMARAFVQGWHQGVLEFWEEIKDKL